VVGWVWWRGGRLQLLCEIDMWIKKEEGGRTGNMVCKRWGASGCKWRVGVVGVERRGGEAMQA
jgi:hypothetical protein